LRDPNMNCFLGIPHVGDGMVWRMIDDWMPGWVWITARPWPCSDVCWVNFTPLTIDIYHHISTINHGS
jgi:hypothetical protein